MITRDSADLWFRPTTPLGDAAEDAGPFGGVCGPLGPDAKKKCKVSFIDFQIYISCAQLRETAHMLAYSSFLKQK